jgi:hypothetical protein
MARRHVALVLDDWDQQRKAAIDPVAKAELKARREEILHLLRPAELDLNTPSYLMLVTSAVAEVRNTLSTHELGDPAEVERLWRASAGSAHGKMWPSIELRVTMDINGRSYTFPDATAMSAILVLAEKVTAFGVARFIEHAGHQGTLPLRLKQVAHDWYARIPKIPGAAETLADRPDVLSKPDE